MKVHYFFREFHKHQISIEKLFDTIISEIKRQGVNVEIFTNPYPFTLLDSLKALFYFKKNQGEINHITGDIHWSCLLLDSKKTVLTIHDLVGLRQLSGIRKKIYYHFWINLPLKKLKYITAISDKTKKEIVEVAPWAEKKIKVIHNCLLTPTKQGTQENYFENKLNFLIVGTRENKNVERMLEAIANLPLKITIVGKLNDEQNKIIAENKLWVDNKVEVSDEELLMQYSKANILCFASLYEGFGLPILEAQSQNCCVITSNASPMAEVAGGAAVLVDPLDVASIRNGVEKLLYDENLRQDLIIAGKHNISKYSAEAISMEYINLYESILTSNNKESWK